MIAATPTTEISLSERCRGVVRQLAVERGWTAIPVEALEDEVESSVARYLAKTGVAPGPRTVTLDQAIRATAESIYFYRVCYLPRGPQRDDALAELANILWRVAHTIARGAGDEDLVAEAVQQMFVVIPQKIGQCREPGTFLPWCFSALRNLILTRLRSLPGRGEEKPGAGSRRRPQLVPLAELTPARNAGEEPAALELRDPHAVDAEKLALRREAILALREVIQESLTDDQRRALIRHLVEGQDYDAVARELGTSRANAYTIVHRARARLREAMERRGYAAGEVLAIFAA